MKKIAIFASGAGSNAAQIIARFRAHKTIQVALIVCNNPEAGVLKIAAKENIPCLIIEKEKFFFNTVYVNELKEKGIDLIVLAGFLWKIPVAFIAAFPGKIINIHPALLPKYGGKGMYGPYVHQAVINNRDKESGISIHYVNEVYDNGKIIFQVTCPVHATDTASLLARRIAVLEHTHYPSVIESIILGIHLL